MTLQQDHDPRTDTRQLLDEREARQAADAEETRRAALAAERLAEAERLKKKNQAKAKKIGAIAGGILLLGGGVGGTIAAVSHPQTVAVGEASGGDIDIAPGTGEDGVETTSAPELVAGEWKVEAGLSDEVFVETIIENRYSPWLMAGATAELKDEWREYMRTIPTDERDGKTGTFTQAQARENASLIQSDLYANTGTPFGNFMIDNNAYNLELFLLTFDSENPKDIEAYQATFELNSFISTASNESGRVFEITLTQHDNADKNKIGAPDSTYGHNPIEGKVLTIIVETQIVDGVEKIVNDYVKS